VSNRPPRLTTGAAVSTWTRLPIDASVVPLFPNPVVQFVFLLFIFSESEAPVFRIASFFDAVEGLPQASDLLWVDSFLHPGGILLSECC